MLICYYTAPPQYEALLLEVSPGIPASDTTYKKTALYSSMVTLQHS
jgi:hypothetical protein